jgi:hypothetical protein
MLPPVRISSAGCGATAQPEINAVDVSKTAFANRIICYVKVVKRDKDVTDILHGMPQNASRRARLVRC